MSERRLLGRECEMPDFEDLKGRLTDDQRSLLTAIWENYLETGQWILGRKLRYLFRNLGREGVETETCGARESCGIDAMAVPLSVFAI